MRTVRLGPGREFDRVRRFLEGGAGESAPGVQVGPGDDAAVLEGGLVVTTDLMMEDVHFLRAWVTLEEAGYRAVAAAGSDLAAMAAQPAAIFLSLAIPDDLEEADVDRLRAGVRDGCAEVGAPLAGGDLSGSPGPLVFDVAALGRADRPVLRSGARPGDELWVTGVLGASADAVRRWKSGENPPPALRDAFVRPRPRIQEALWLRERGHLRALLDLSDGLGGDAAHLAAASGVAVVLERTDLPVHPTVREGDTEDHRGRAVELALHGGEDYELLFAAPPGRLGGEAVADFRDRFGVPLTRVGLVEEGSGVFLRSAEGGVPERLARGGFDHFHDPRVNA